jgi:hypothetical protein
MTAAIPLRKPSRTYSRRDAETSLYLSMMAVYRSEGFSGLVRANERITKRIADENFLAVLAEGWIA